MEQLFAAHGQKIVMAARFLPGVRAVTYFTAGSARMPYLRFILWDGFAALVSAPVFVWLGFHFGEKLDAAAEYLGVTDEEVREALESGKSLAEIAEEKGKSVDGLKDALLAEAETRLDEAVTEEKLTREQADRILERLRGEKRFEREHTEGLYRVFQCAYGGFRRIVPLPAQVRARVVQAPVGWLLGPELLGQLKKILRRRSDPRDWMPYYRGCVHDECWGRDGRLVRVIEPPARRSQQDPPRAGEVRDRFDGLEPRLGFHHHADSAPERRVVDRAMTVARVRAQVVHADRKDPALDCLGDERGRQGAGEVLGKDRDDIEAQHLKDLKVLLADRRRSFLPRGRSRPRSTPPGGTTSGRRRCPTRRRRRCSRAVPRTGPGGHRPPWQRWDPPPAGRRSRRRVRH